MKRSYSQHCALADALDLVGERWTLLVVRELLLGPRRFGELAGALPGIGPNLLSRRLRELGEAGVIERDGPRYALTDRGRGLEDAVLALARWGLEDMDAPDGTRAFRPEWLAVALRALGDPGAGEGAWELRVDGVPFAVEARAGRVDVRPGTAAAPSLVVALSPGTLLDLVHGRVAPEDAELTLSGPHDELQRLLRALGRARGGRAPSPRRSARA